MHITLDEQQILDAVRTAATEAVAHGVADWGIRKGIAEAARDAVTASGLMLAIGPAIEGALREHASVITRQVVADALPAVTLACVESLRVALVTMVVALREQGHAYMTTEERERLRVQAHAEMFGVSRPVLERSA